MATKKRLIDAYELWEKAEALEKTTAEEFGWQEMCDGICQVKDLIEEAPMVDAVVLPCKVGTQIWLTKWRCSGMRWLKLIEPKPRTIHYFDITKYGVFAHFNDGYVNVTDFGETVFLTKEEAKAALVKMDGGTV